MDEMCLDLGMPGVLENAGRPFRSVEAFQNCWRAKIIVRLVERDRYGAGHHKQSLNLGLKKIVTGKDCFSEDRCLNGKEAQGSNVWNPGVVSF